MVKKFTLQKAAILASSILLMLVLIRCSFPESYSGISWNAEFNIPLMNKTYPVFDLEDGNNIIIEDDLLYLVYNEDLESDEVASELKINPKTSEITQISSLETGTYIAMSIDDVDEIDLIYGIIEEGTIKIEVLEPRPELEELNIVFLDIYDTDGNPLNAIIRDFETSIHSYDIDGYSVGEVDGEEVIDELLFYVETTSQEPLDDLLYLRIFFDETIYFYYFRGYMDDKEIVLFDDILNSEVNMPVNISDALQLEEAILELTFTNELGFDAKFLGTLTGINKKDNKEYSMIINEEDEVIFDRASEIDIPTTTTVVIDKPELVELINIFPDEILIENSRFLLGNADQTPGFATTTDRNCGDFSLTIPSLFSVSNETIVPDTVHTIEITEENREQIEEYLEAVTLNIFLENTLPLGANVDLYFSESPDTLNLFNPDIDPAVHTIVFSDNIVPAAVTDTDPSTEEVLLNMSRDDIELFLNEEIFLAMKITFEESDGTVVVLPQHYLKVLGRIKINLNIDL